MQVRVVVEGGESAHLSMTEEDAKQFFDVLSTSINQMSHTEGNDLQPIYYHPSGFFVKLKQIVMAHCINGLVYTKYSRENK